MLQQIDDQLSIIQDDLFEDTLALVWLVKRAPTPDTSAGVTSTALPVFKHVSD